MTKKLNEIIDAVKLRLLSLDQLRQRVQEILDAEEKDEEALEQLSEEVQRRLAKATQPEERAALQTIADLIARHRLMRAMEEELAIRLRRRRRRDDDDDWFGPRKSVACMCSVPDEPADDH
jgi:replication-associated recombination protein RarA